MEEIRKIQPVCPYTNKPQIPLYKYYSNIKYAMDAIENDRIHFESPNTYNDIYDSSTVIDTDMIMRGHMAISSICKLLKSFATPNFIQIIDDFEKMNQENTMGVFRDFYDYAISEGCKETELIDLFEKVRASLYKTPFTDLTLLDYRVSCFSEVNNSLIMWAYYADSSRGVCLEFDLKSNRLLYDNCQKVQYSPNHYGNEKDFGKFFRKSTEWQHEQEWRIVFKGKIEYIKNIKVKSIFIGVRTSETDEEKIIQIAKQKGITVYKCFQNRYKFKLEFEKIV